MLIKGYIFSMLYGALCLVFGMLAFKLGMPKKYSRKLVHILVGFEWVILYTFMGAGYHFLIVCLSFTALLCITHFGKMLPMMSSDGDNAPGTVYYGVAMSVLGFISMLVPEMMLPFGIGVFCTSLGDGFAGLFGQLVKKYNPHISESKTLIGTLVNLAVSFLVVFFFNTYFEMGLEIWHVLLISYTSAGIELVCKYGLDNIFVTLCTAFLTFAIINLPTFNYYIVPILLTPIVIYAVTLKKVLTKLGLLFAIILDIVISLTLGNSGFVLLLLFLFGSVIIDKIKVRRSEADTIAKKGDCRDHIQVIANGLVPMVMALMFSITMQRAFLLGYVASLAEAFGDTAASGIGSFSKNTFDIARLKRCDKGISGGISLIGTLAGVLGVMALSFVAYFFGIVDPFLLLIVSVSAFLGVLFDSILGSLLQVKYKCTVCGKITEREEHCEKRTKIHRGYPFFDNDVVNLLSGAFSAVLAVLLFNVLI